MSSEDPIHPGGIVRVNAIDHAEDMEWLTTSTLCVIVVGASGDLAKKMTYPALLDLYDDNLLPRHFRVIGLARSAMADDELRGHLRPYLQETGDHAQPVIERFLKRCVYHRTSSYGDLDAYSDLANSILQAYEEEHAQENASIKHFNRLFYFAIPPSVFADTATAIKKTCMQDESKGWTRLIVEKPFGRDLESFEDLNKVLAEHFTEDHIYRIDHYLGKEMVQNLQVIRFSNIWFEKVWDRNNIQCVMLTLKEPFGTKGRGGYFDEYGIIRDVCQNHLLQVLTLLAMETPSTMVGTSAANAIRDAKVAVLNAIEPLTLDDVILGQYEGYADDETIKNKDTNTPTFCCLHFKINTPRWEGVPFIMKAGKALNEKKAEMRIQFRDSPSGKEVFQGNDCPRNELVMRVQPHEAIYMKTNVKSPGFAAKPIQSELEVNYETRFFDHQREANPGAYTRLILDVLQKRHAAFVRDDELRRAWEIFTPLLHQIEKENIRPIIYKEGTRGPSEADEFITRKAGYVRNEDYVFYEGNVARKTEGTNLPPTLANPLKEYSEEELCDIGVFGLSIVGINLALNMAENGFKVAIGNRTVDKVPTVVERAKSEENLSLTGADSPMDLVARLKKPRKLLILIQAGKPVDDAVSTFSRYLEAGDVLIDGGDEWFPNSIRRCKFLEPKGIHFISMGISGGEQEIRKGPSMMAGGSKAGYELVAPIFTKIAAQVEETGACAGYLGPIGAGDYVKMVHNGIEYGDLQLIAEIYDILKNVLSMDNEEIANVFEEWNKTELASYLLEITVKILRRKDDETGQGYLTDYIVDKAGMKGTGSWTIKEAAEKSVAVPTLAGAVYTRILSSRKEEREKASTILEAVTIPVENKDQVVQDLHAALYASKSCSYAQGLQLIKAASNEYEWDIDLSECARLWMGGCVVRSKLLSTVHASCDGTLTNLMAASCLAPELNKRSTAWRRAVTFAITNGVACPSLCGSLSYFDTYRRGRLPTNLIQAQRDFFGSHSYERIDKPGRFHTAWTDYHKEIIGDTAQRAEGEHLQTDIQSPLE